MAELNPNCSELVIRLPEEYTTKKDILRELKELNIKQADVVGFWGFYYDDTKLTDKEKEECAMYKNMLVDADNPNSPDCEHHATIHIARGGTGYDYPHGQYLIWAHQHCQNQLFPTLHKIAEYFGVEPEGNDGGSSENYDEWVAGGCLPIENYNEKNEWAQKVREKLFPPKVVRLEL